MRAIIQCLDDPAFTDAPSALFNRMLEFGAQRSQVGDVAVNLCDMPPGKCVNLGAGTVGLGAHIQKPPDRIDLESQLARVADEIQPRRLAAFIAAPPALCARRRNVGFQMILRQIGRKVSLISNVQESLLTLQRVATYFDQTMRGRKMGVVLTSHVKTLSRDVRSLADYSSTLSP
uniref:Uncharacterized protein n=1 Tax=Rhizobium leguminosarum TaxID=384 RepID=A0A154I9E0_RHILE|nr:hypothetical protein A4A59_33195 [Rhizobium leguminosarum]